MRKLGASAAALVTLVFVPDASGGWQQPVGGANPINQSPTREAHAPTFAVFGGVPHVAWAEFDGTNREIRVARLSPDGTDWVQPWQTTTQVVDDTHGLVNQSDSRTGSEPSLAVIGGKLYIAWGEQDSIPDNTDIRVAELRNDSQGLRWVQAWDDVDNGDGGINFSETEQAGAPHLAGVGNVPYVTWREWDGTNMEIRVARLNSATDEWDRVGVGAPPTTDGGINVDGAASGEDPFVADVGGVPHVAWREDGPGAALHVRVARFNGTLWQEVVAAPLNESATGQAFDPVISTFDGVPYVAWHEIGPDDRDVHVARLNGAGNAWERPWATATSGGVDHQLDEDGSGPSLATVDGRLYVGWGETDNDGPLNSQARVARLNASGDGWDHVVDAAAPINDVGTGAAGDVRVAGVGTVPWVSWTEGMSERLRVARLQPEFTSLTAVPSANGATLAAGVTHFGVRFPVRFEFGVSAEQATPTQATPFDAESSVIAAAVDGLAPDTDHSYRAGTVAEGANQAVFGPFSTFRTLVAPAGSPSPPGSPPPAGPGPTPADTRAAVFSNLSLSRSSFRAASSGASVAGRSRRRTPIGTRVSYALDEAATVTFTVERMSPGRRVRGRCVKQTRSNRRRPRCTRVTAVRGSFTHAGKVGGNRFTFRGRVGGRKLGVGSYRLNARAVDAAGNRSPVARVNFKVVRR